jgi:hypothetical protein
MTEEPGPQNPTPADSKILVNYLQQIILNQEEQLDSQGEEIEILESINGKLRFFVIIVVLEIVLPLLALLFGLLSIPSLFRR